MNFLLLSFTLAKSNLLLIKSNYFTILHCFIAYYFGFFISQCFTILATYQFLFILACLLAVLLVLSCFVEVLLEFLFLVSRT